jgi:glutathione peroxidase
MLRTLCLSTLAVATAATMLVHAEEKKSVPAPLNFTMKSLDGKDVDLSKYEGKVVLIVNVASECGLTPQYETLQTTFDRYKDQGFVVLGFPCNQFGSQEPGTATEIKEFCTKNYGVTFDMFSKIDVNGDGAAPLYKLLTATETQPKGAGKVSWNFEKFLLNRKGEVVARFDPRITPDSQDVTSRIEKELASK